MADMAPPMPSPLARLDLEGLRQQFARARPFPHVVIDDFLDPAFARELAEAYPTFETAKATGVAFNAVNERKKVQIADAKRFPASVRRLSDALSSPEFLIDLTAVTGISHLLADETLTGGGMHLTGPHGRLDVHVDFNLLDGGLFRRLNLLLYLNADWREDWGGEIELWDPDVTACGRRLAPALGRCLIFETSAISFHGVAPLRCPPDAMRRSFAAYYYTKEPPDSGADAMHSTIFRARPDEWWRAWALMPAERVQRRIAYVIKPLYYATRRLVGRVIGRR